MSETHPKLQETGTLVSSSLFSEMQDSKSAAGQPTSTMMEARMKAVLEADRGKEAILTSWNFSRKPEKPHNFGSIVINLKICFLKNDEALESNYVVKHNPNLNSAFTVYVTTLFNKEIGFYENLKPLLLSEMSAIGQPKLCTPRCFFTSLDEGREVIILEDLRTHGFQMTDRKKGMDVAHASLVLQELARMHAASVLLKKKFGQEEMETRNEFLAKTWWNYREGAEEMFLINMKGHLDIAASVLQKLGGYESSAKWLLGLKFNILQLVKEQTQKSPPFDVLCHADCTSSNFLFRYSAEREVCQAMVLDFQMCLHTSLANDLAHFLFCCLDGPVRRANQEAFFTTYFQSFTSVLMAAGDAAPFSFQDLLQEYKKKIIYGAVMAILVVPLLASEDEDMPDVENIVDDTSFLVNRQENLRTSLYSNSRLRTRFLDIFNDLIANGVITE